jgi:GNAT superfamily N-acetyltransferase
MSHSFQGSSSAATSDIDALRAIAHASLMAPSPLERYRPAPPRRATHGAVTLVSAGDAGPDFNAAIVLGPARPDAVFALAAAFFDDAAYSIVVEVGVAPGVEDELQRRGWQRDEEEAALVFSPPPAVVPPTPAALTIRRVIDASGLDAFRSVTETPSVVLPSLAAALDPAVALLVGYDAGCPVATARLTQLGSITEITGVVTVPAARRRGYGTALTWAALAEGRARGGSAAVLTATEMGYPVYVRMGFRPVGVYRTYLPPD